MMLEPIQLENVSLRRQGRTILSDISVSLVDRRIGILGTNGSGKTSLLRLIAGLDSPDHGRVRIGDLDPAKDRRAVIDKIGILFQSPDHQILFPTVIEELRFGLMQQGLKQPAAEQMVRDALRAEGRAHWADALCHRLSQGQRQYLCLLAVLLMNPDTLLLDEPFAALDLPTTTRLKRRLVALPQRLILITHDPDNLRDFDQILWLDNGSLRGNGSPSQILPLVEADLQKKGAGDADLDLAP